MAPETNATDAIIRQEKSHTKRSIKKKPAGRSKIPKIPSPDLYSLKIMITKKAAAKSTTAVFQVVGQNRCQGNFGARRF